jgi:hypothetical protein
VNAGAKPANARQPAGVQRRVFGSWPFIARGDRYTIVIYFSCINFLFVNAISLLCFLSFLVSQLK